MKVYICMYSYGAFSCYGESILYISLDKEKAIKELDKFVSTRQETIDEKKWNYYDDNDAWIEERELDSNIEPTTIKKYVVNYNDYYHKPTWELEGVI